MYFDVPGPDDIADQRGVMMLTMDPPRHTALRALVSKGFKPRQVAKLNERIRKWRAKWSTASSSGRVRLRHRRRRGAALICHRRTARHSAEDGYRLYELTEIMDTGLIGGSAP